MSKTLKLVAGYESYTLNLGGDKGFVKILKGKTVTVDDDMAEELLAEGVKLDAETYKHFWADVTDAQAAENEAEGETGGKKKRGARAAQQ